jgi:peptidyl-prolyl cis-trans isomerase C
MPVTARHTPPTATQTVVVDGVEIPEFLIAEEVQNHPSLSAVEARRAAGKALAVKALLLHRADELGLQAQPECDEAGREETDEEALIRATLDAEVEVDAPSDAECRRVYDAQPNRFTSPALVEAAHILIEVKGEVAADWDAGLETAQQVLAALTRDPGAFAGLAKELSACPSRDAGGSLGQLSSGDVVSEIEQALEDLRPSAVLDRPVRSRFGWHILKLDRRIEGQRLPFDYVVETIRLHLESRAWAAAATRYVSELAERARAHGVAFSLSRDGRFDTGARSLGDLLSADGSAAGLEAWLDATDPDLAGRARLAAQDAGQTLPQFVQGAVKEFVNHADDERWTQLISAVQGAADPAVSAMTSLLKARLTPKPAPGVPSVASGVRTYTIIKRR